MNSDDIEETNNVAVSNNQPGSSQLVVRGGTVILPERCRCRPGDAVFDAQLEAILPDDVGPVLLRQMANQHRRPTFFLIPALLLFFALSLYFMYAFFPRMLPAIPGQLSIPAPEYAAPQPKHLYEIFKKGRRPFIVVNTTNAISCYCRCSIILTGMSRWQKRPPCSFTTSSHSIKDTFLRRKRPGHAVCSHSLARRNPIKSSGKSIMSLSTPMISIFRPPFEI